MAKQTKLTPGRYQDRDPLTGRPIESGITAIVSDALGVTYQARWSWTGPDGKRHQEAETFKTLDAAEETLLENKLKIKRGIYVPNNKITMQEYYDQWYKRLSISKWRTSTAFRVRSTWEHHFKDSVGGVPLTKMNRSLCQREADRLMNLKNPRDAAKPLAEQRPLYAPGTIRLFLTVLTGVLEGAFREGIIDRNPALRLEIPKDRTKTKAVWTVAQAKTFLAKTADDPFHVLWWFMLTTGCRVGEAAALSWSAVDLDAGRVTFRATRRRKADGGWEIAAGTKTSDEDQTIPLVPEMVTLFAELRRDQRSKPVVDLDGLVFPTKTGAPMGERVVAHALDRCILTAGVPRITPHGMRHTTSMLLRALKVPDSVIKDVLRHKSIETTVDIYMQSDEELLREAVTRLEQAYGSR